MTSEQTASRKSLFVGPIPTKLVCDEADLRGRMASLVLRNTTNGSLHQFDLPIGGRNGQMLRMIGASAHLDLETLTTDKLLGLTLRLMLCPADGAIVDLAMRNPTVVESFVTSWPHHHEPSTISSRWTSCGKCVDRLQPAAQPLGPTWIHSTGTGSADQIEAAQVGDDEMDKAWARFTGDIDPQLLDGDTIVLNRTHKWKLGRFGIPRRVLTIDEE